MKYTQYTGILLGALYGLLFRYLGGLKSVEEFYSIYSISFIWIVPVVVGLIPVLFAHKEVLNSKTKLIAFPFLSVLLFFILAMASGLEDLFCILIIAFPFLVSAGVLGVVLGIFMNRRKKNKLYTLLILPFILNPIESVIPDTTTDYEVQSKIFIHAPKEQVWENIIEVPEISDSEYEKGFFNYLGVPGPVKSTLETIDGTEFRIGYFSGGLKLYETISKMDSLNHVNFNIHIDKSELRDVPLDKHLLESRYFKFENISYHLREIDEHTTELSLKCNYTIESKMNWYANFWAEAVIKDFEIRLLNTLKVKTEKTNAF